MPIFGQVWLWSLLAFLLGAVLCWVLVVLPVRRRIAVLESRLAALRADAKVSAATERSRLSARPDAPPSEPEDEIRPDTLTRAYALPGVANVPSTPYPVDPAPSLPAVPPVPAGQPEPAVPPEECSDWFDDRRPAQPAHALRDEDEDYDEEERGTIFAQRTTPISRDLIRRLDGAEEPAAEPEPEPEPEGQPSRAAHRLGEARPDDAVPDREPPADPTTFLPTVVEPAEPEHRYEPAAGNGVLAASSEVDIPVDAGTPAPPPPPPPAPPSAPPLPKRPSRASRATAFESSRSAPSIAVEPERSPTALPKRIPAKPQHRHPFGVAVSSPATPAVDGGGEPTRALFEPIVPAEGGDDSLPPPPRKLQTTAAPSTPAPAPSRPSPPGPFGPGSAMPLPGGASPSPEFTIKASVTALRYCTPESAQFGRTVAEVWFRTAADAERVGFRPVG
ncbi:MAG TPA: hypothetical protein VFV67_04670 [Actinophytocola sp.]|uniref:sunset domain-containing protein n=1 Tax=Actinophytocola sp. TaxID=1872138 RepID=UPI002DBB5CD6|nr:hypothetical protein [Actinophytocola sp.]HEU5469924.1 hypothetical protein [Actinophytocola sp.]